MERWYPPEARSKGMQGFVTVSVTLDPAGKLVEAHVLKETPAGHGFGEASVAAAKNFIYANPTGQPVTTSFNVKFALND
jgi:TonB family protein